MTSTFPLLSALQSQVEETTDPLTIAEKSHLSQAIRKFGREPAERVYGLIRAYSINSGDSCVIGLPFEGQALKSGPKFDLEHVPQELQRILQKFVELHLETHTN